MGILRRTSMSNLAQRIAELSPEKREIFLQQLKGKRKLVQQKGIQVQKRAESGTTSFPLSHAQQRLWFLQQLEPANPSYHIPLPLRLRGALDEPALQASLDELLRRHESLRTCFPAPAGQPVQRILPPSPVELVCLDLCALPQPEQERQVQEGVTQASQQPFDLAHGPLLRAHVFCLGAQDHVLLLCFHHICFDGWSLGLFFSEFATLYEAFHARQPCALPALPIQYADYAVWQRQWLDEERLAAHLAYWRERLADAPVLTLPTDHPRPSRPGARGASRSLRLSPQLSQQVQQLSQQANVTVFMTLLAAWQALLARYSGQERISVGTPIANRTQAETEGVIGCFVNTLVLHTSLAGNPRFVELVERVREVALGAYAHQEVPFEKLVEELEPQRESSRSPLFQVLFTLQNLQFDQGINARCAEMTGLHITPLQMEHTTAKFDLSL